MAAQELGLHQNKVASCARGIQRKTGGYEFRFADVPEAALLPGEEWREVNVLLLQRDKQARKLQNP